MPSKVDLRERKRQKKVRETLRKAPGVPGGLSSEAFSRVIGKLESSLKTIKRNKKKDKK